MTLTEQAQQAADLWGGQGLALIRNRENAVFRMRLPDGSEAALRLHRPGYQGEAAILSELWWCAALADAGLPVPRPISSRGGDLLGRAGDRSASALTWLPGAPLGEAGVALPQPAAEQVALHFKLGVLLAKVHEATDALTLPETFVRPRWDLDGLCGETPFWGRYWEHPALTAPEAKRLALARQTLHNRFRSLEASEPLGPIHADVLRENILVNDGSLSLIDFDDSGIGFRAYDLGTVLSQNLYEHSYTKIRAALIEGYQSLRPVDPQIVDLFTLARSLASVGWTMPRLAPEDPIMRSHIARALRCCDLVLG
jgi:Ser/Thr protein kinase RdoA (MazF antagonist)